MANRTPIIELVDYHNGISWRVTPDELRYWVQRLGLPEVRKQMHEQLDRALSVSEASGSLMSSNEPKPQLADKESREFWDFVVRVAAKVRKQQEKRGWASIPVSIKAKGGV